MQLWEQAQREMQGKGIIDMGTGSVWLNKAEMAFDHKKGAFNHRRLREMKSEGHSSVRS